MTIEVGVLVSWEYRPDDEEVGEDEEVPQDLLNYSIQAAAITVPQLKYHAVWRAEGRGVGGRPPVSTVFCDTLQRLYQQIEKGGKVVLLGLPGMKAFLRKVNLAAAAAGSSHTLPPQVLQSAIQGGQELLADSDVTISDFLRYRSANETNPTRAEQLTEMAAQFIAPGRDVSLDDRILLTMAVFLGYQLRSRKAAVVEG